jgi:hypothetical protein
MGKDVCKRSWLIDECQSSEPLDSFLYTCWAGGAFHAGFPYCLRRSAPLFLRLEAKGGFRGSRGGAGLQACGKADKEIGFSR